jgi:hypothetical protein
MGHERRHSPSKPSVRSYGAERTFTEVSENGRDAPQVDFPSGTGKIGTLSTQEAAGPSPTRPAPAR